MQIIHKGAVLITIILCYSCGYTIVEETAPKPNRFLDPSIESLYTTIVQPIKTKLVSGWTTGNSSFASEKIVSAKISIGLNLIYENNIYLLDSLYSIIYILPDSSIQTERFHNTRIDRNINGTFNCTFHVGPTVEEGWIEIFLMRNADITNDGKKFNDKITSNRVRRYLRLIK